MLIKGEVMKKSQIMRPVLGMLLAALLLTGCDWVKRQLGMPTSEDLAKLKMEMEQKELRERQIKDSIEAARLDSLRLAQEKEIRQAIDDAVDTCIRNGILEEILRNNREEVCSMLLTEYDEQAHIESEREIALKEGEAIGRAAGREEGRKAGREEGLKEGELRLAKLMQLLIDSGRTDDMNRALVDLEYREQLYQENHL